MVVGWNPESLYAMVGKRVRQTMENPGIRVASRRMLQPGFTHEALAGYIGKVCVTRLGSMHAWGLAVRQLGLLRVCAHGVRMHQSLWCDPANLCAGHRKSKQTGHQLGHGMLFLGRTDEVHMSALSNPLMCCTCVCSSSPLAVVHSCPSGTQSLTNSTPCAWPYRAAACCLA